MTSKVPISPDDICEVCSTKRDEHGDRNHKFSTDGELVPLEKAAKPRQEPPKERSTVQHAFPGTNDMASLHLRLVERLVAKGLFDAEDLLYIFGGKTHADN